MDLSNPTEVKKEESRIHKQATTKVELLGKDRLNFLEDWNKLRKKNDDFLRKLQQDLRNAEEKKLQEKVDVDNKEKNDINNPKEDMPITINITAPKEKEDTVKKVEVTKKESLEFLSEDSKMIKNSKLEEQLYSIKEEVTRNIQILENKVEKTYNSIDN